MPVSLHGEHQRFGGFLLGVIQSGHSRNRKGMGKDLPALEPEISRSAPVGEGHPKHIVSEFAHAAGRKLLRQKIQRIGTVAHGLRRISGKAGIRFEYQLFQILGVNCALP